MKIQVFGSGCAKCAALERNALEAVEQLGLDAEVIKVTDLEKMMAEGIMMTPALKVDDRMVSTGKLLSVKELVAILGG